MQHGLAGDAEALGGLGERHETVGNLGHEAGADLVGQADPPGRVGGGLLAGQQPVPEPAADSERGYVELRGGELLVASLLLAGAIGELWQRAGSRGCFELAE